jgi:hypothetical protein
LELILLIALGIVLGMVLLVFLPLIIQLLLVFIIFAITAVVLAVSSSSFGVILSDTSTATLVAITAISASALTLYFLKRKICRYSIQIKQDHDWIHEADYLSYRAAYEALKRRTSDLQIVYSDGKPISSALRISGVRVIRRLRWMESENKTPTVLSENLIPATSSL